MNDSNVKPDDNMNLGKELPEGWGKKFYLNQKFIFW